MTRRRAVLRAAVGAAVGGLAGCLGGDDGQGTGGGTPTGTAGGVPRLPSLDVAGSPGGILPVRRPGTVSLVDFFATWCAPCEPQMRNLAAVRAEFGAEDLYMTSITTERDEESVRAFWREFDAGWPVLQDGDVVATEAYDVRGIPTLVVVDGDGAVQWRHRGLAGEDTLLAKVREALSG